MGIYINSLETKEEFLSKNALLITEQDVRNLDLELVISSGSYPVCLVNNGSFTAAAVASNEKELNEFLRPDDKRPKYWFLIEKRHLTKDIIGTEL